jgi:RNA polymerase primary sigma factor
MRQIKIAVSITNRDSQSIDKYLQEISKIPLLNPDDESRLATLIRRGDSVAMDTLVKANLRFVVSVAKQYQNKGLSLADLINEGNLGLIKAAEKYDETKGFKFISYAVWWIRQSILQALAEQGRIVRLPVNKVGLTNRISRAYAQLEQQLEREPSPEELAEWLDTDTREIYATLGVAAKHISMDQPIQQGEETSFMDLFQDKQALSTDAQLAEQDSLQTELERTLGSLTVRQKEVVSHFFGIGIEQPQSLEDIGRRYNLTRERVRQIKDKAITQLRASAQANLLRGFLG